MAGSKKNNRTLWLAILLIVLLGGLVWYYSLGPRWIWYERYLYNENEPYDASMITGLLEAGAGSAGFELVTDTIYRKINLKNLPEGSNIFYIGQQINLDSADRKFMLDFVSRGHTVFIASDDLPKSLIDSLLNMEQYFYMQGDYSYTYQSKDEYYYSSYRPVFNFGDTTIELSLVNGTEDLPGRVSCAREVNWKKVMNDWIYFRDSLFTHEDKYVQVLGHFNQEYPNFISIPYGRGRFLFHTTPLVFSNYMLQRDSLMRYARNCLAYMGPGKIFFDEKDTHYDYGPQADDSPLPPEKGPLAFILSEPALKSAWYTLLGATALFLMFGLKRRQRVIPIADNMDNTSIEYAEVISQLFMKESDHSKLVVLKMELFAAFVRERLAIRIPANIKLAQEDVMKHIAVKSDVPLKEVKEIFETYAYLSSLAEVETADMLRFYRMLEQFYAKCK